MFEIPNAKRVRREELYDSSSADGSNGQDDAEDQEVRAKLNERLSRLLGLDLDLDLSSSEPASGGRQQQQQQQQQESPPRPQPTAPADTPALEHAEAHEDKHEEEFEFRLFATSARAAAPTKVILAASDDEDAEPGEGAFTVPERPLEYYLVGQPTPEELERYRSSAVAGEDILLGARKRAWGLERPWRLVKITASARAGTALAAKTSSSNPSSKDGVEQQAQKEKRKRPGKKRRIAMRIKTKADKAKQEVEEKQKVSKEEHVAEKKKRLNRERKLKRRAKEREKKMATKGEDGTLQASADAVDSGSDSGSD